MESALESVQRVATSHGATRVSRIVLRIGSLSGVDHEALRFAYEALAPHSFAAGAELEILAVEARAYCPTCCAEFGATAGHIFTCPTCGQLSGDLRSGRELGIARLEFPETP